MSRRDSIGYRKDETGNRVVVLAAVVLGVALWNHACGTDPPPPDPPRPTTVTVTPSSAELAALEATVQLAAEVRDQYGDVMSGASVSWASSDVSVAMVDAGGLVTAVGNGAATITAMSGQASGTAAVTVEQAVSAVAVTPAADTLVAMGDTVRLTAEASDANGHPVVAAEFTWSSGDTLVAIVDDSGLVTGLAPGRAAVSATSSGVTGAAELTVVPTVASQVEVTPAEALLASLGDTVRLVAEVRDQIGRVMPGAEVLWSSVDTVVATVDSAGLVTAAGNGDATVTASSGEASGEARMTVMQSADSVNVSPATATITPEDTLRLSAEAFDANGHLVAGAEFMWSTSDASVASVDTAGLVRGVLPGVVTVRAVSGDVEGTADITVENPDRAPLVALYEATGGPNWFDNTNWLSDRPIYEWQGVRVNDQRRVISLYLPNNNLIGSLPAELARLSQIEELNMPFNGLSGGLPPELGILLRLRQLRLDSNQLTGPIPSELGALSELVRLQLGQNSLSGPIPPELGDLSKLEYLAIGANQYRSPIPPELGRLSRLKVLSLRSALLTGGIPPELGELSSLEVINLFGNDLSGPIPVGLFAGMTGLRSLQLANNRFAGPLPAEIGGLSQLESLALSGNNLTGPIPSELGGLTRLVRLQLGRTGLTGPIPPEFGGLQGLKLLTIYETGITGPLPAELGSLTSLEELHLYDNEITGPIPAEWGAMASLRAALLFGNRLTGPLPPELGDLEALEWLWLSGNDLEGGVPSRFGSMAALRELDLTNNGMMSGPLPGSLTQLGQLEALLAGGTGICVPDEEPFTGWLGRIWKQRVALCEGTGESGFLLIQAIQSLEFPVPLVAGRTALLRVFVTAPNAGGADIPPVRASFYFDDNEVHVAEIDGQSTAIPDEVVEGDLSKSANAAIPGDVLRPETEIVIEIDPEGTLDPDVQITRRIPEEGRLKLDIRAMPALDLTVIPFLWTQNPDSSILETTAGMAADPAGHELLDGTRVLLPIGELAVTNHDAVASGSNSAFAILQATDAIRVVEGGTGHYMGMMAGSVTQAAGVAFTPGRSSFSIPVSRTIAHELGHNMNTLHAPCGGAGAPDPAFPTGDGSIGGWGYDSRNATLVPPGTKDLMTYCRPPWISDFNFSNSLRFRLVDETRGSARTTGAARPTILLWGGTGPNGTPFLEPAFLVSAPPSLPTAGGDHGLTGTDEDGRELFSLSFAMREVADADGRSAFAFALPARPDWVESLAAITLSGPGGSVTLDGDTDRPMAILRDPRTGQVRGFLRDLPQSVLTRADAIAYLSPDGNVEVLFSRGVPEGDAWRR